MIRITANITYGCHNGKTVERKTKNSPPFEAGAAEKELVEKGLAEYVDAEPSEVTLEYLKALKMSDLKGFAEEIGVKYKTGTKKDAFAEIVWNAYSAPMSGYGGYSNPFGYPEDDNEQI